MRGIVLVIFLAGLVCLPVNAPADGGFIPATALERVQIPDQRALLHYAQGKETLVIDTAFKGTGTNFAWVVPVPSVPTVEPATSGLFPTLQLLFQPRIVHEPFPFYWVALFGGLLVAWVLWRRHTGQPLLEVLAVITILLLLAGMLLPALGTAAATASPGRVSVLERKRVGIYETVTLASPDGQALFDWLKQNGFVVRTNFIPVLRAYAQEGWCFVASRIPLDAPLADGADAPPLALRFKTDRPVYPLRLTGIDNVSCRIELYVFGPSRAELPHFQVERCGAVSYPRADARANWRLEELRIRHPLLRRLVEGSPAATRLVGELSSNDMREDAYLAWKPLAEKRTTRYSAQAAAVVAANCAVPVLVTALLILLWSHWACKTEPVWARRADRLSRILLLVALVGWGTLYAGLPRTKVVVSHLPRFQIPMLHKFLAAELAQRMAEQKSGKDGKASFDVRWVREQLAESSEFRRTLSSTCQTNVLTGERWREEDSPGNCTLRQTPTGIDYVWYDLEGGENVVPLSAEPRGH